MTDKDSKTSPPPWSWSPPPSGQEVPAVSQAGLNEANQPSGSFQLKALSKTPQKSQPAPVQAFVGQGVLVRGDISFSNLLRVEGRIRGDLHGGRLVVVIKGAQIEGDICADEVIIVEGMVKGDIKATKMIELSPLAHVEGNLEAPRVNLQPGAKLLGECRLLPVG